jgi:hypothetical protein
MTLAECQRIPQDEALLKRTIRSHNIPKAAYWRRFKPSTLDMLNEWLQQVSSLVAVKPSWFYPSLPPNSPETTSLPISPNDAQWIHEPLFELDLEFDESILLDDADLEKLQTQLSLAAKEPLVSSVQDEILDILRLCPELVVTIDNFADLLSNNSNLAYRLLILAQDSFKDESRYELTDPGFLTSS